MLRERDTGQKREPRASGVAHLLLDVAVPVDEHGHDGDDLASGDGALDLARDAEDRLVDFAHEGTSKSFR